MQKAVRVRSVSEGTGSQCQRPGDLLDLSFGRTAGRTEGWVQGAGCVQHSVGRDTPHTFYSRNFDARKFLESFLGLSSKVQGRKLPWVTAGSEGPRSRWPHIYAEIEKSMVCVGFIPLSGYTGRPL